MNNTQTVAPITHVFYTIESESRQADIAVIEGDHTGKEFATLDEAVQKVSDLIEIGSYEVVECNEDKTILRRGMFFNQGWRFVIVAEASQF